MQKSKKKILFHVYVANTLINFWETTDIKIKIKASEVFNRNYF